MISRSECSSLHLRIWVISIQLVGFSSKLRLQGFSSDMPVTVIRTVAGTAGWCWVLRIKVFALPTTEVLVSVVLQLPGRKLDSESETRRHSFSLATHFKFLLPLPEPVSHKPTTLLPVSPSTLSFFPIPFYFQLSTAGSTAWLG